MAVCFLNLNLTITSLSLSPTPRLLVSLCPGRRSGERQPEPFTASLVQRFVLLTDSGHFSLSISMERVKQRNSGFAQNHGWGKKKKAFLGSLISIDSLVFENQALKDNHVCLGPGKGLCGLLALRREFSSFSHCPCLVPDEAHLLPRSMPL